MDKKVIDDLKKISLSNFDVLNLLNGKANLVLYPEIIKFKNIDELLGKYGACVILYLTKENYGHWCCIFKQNKKVIQFFDSYGEGPDDQLNYKIDPYFRKKNNLQWPLLSYLLFLASKKYDIHYNECQFQGDGKDVNTCGRWCVVRIWLRDLDEYEFEDFIFGTKLNPDELVSILTKKIY